MSDNTLDLTDAELDEMIGDGSCVHLPQVRMALEIRRHRAASQRLREWANDMEALSEGMGYGPSFGAAKMRSILGCVEWPVGEP